MGEGSEHSPRIVVLLGAGASHDAGLPLAADLTERLRAELKASNDRSLLNALGLIQSSIYSRRGMTGEKIDPRIDIEEILRIADLLAERTENPLAGYVAAWNTALEDLSPGGDGHLFRTLISRARHMLREALAEPNDLAVVKYLSGIARINQPLGQLGDAAFPTVFTLNYDRCVELAFGYVGVPFTTGFEDGRWDADRFADTDVLRLYKIHGSFGWVRHPESAVLYDADQAIGREDIDIESYDVPDELVFGTVNKLQSRQPFLWMVNQFSEEVRECSYVVTIGYGFGDSYVNDIIREGMAADARKRLVVVAPGFGRDELEEAPAMRVYPERTSFLDATAKEALHDKDTILKELERLHKAAADETPF